MIVERFRPHLGRIEFAREQPGIRPDSHQGAGFREVNQS
jgi:hypothetical protein